MTYLLDTDIVIYYFKRKEPYTSTIESLLDNASVVVSAITIAETRTGWTQEKANVYMPKLYDLFQVEKVTRDIAEKAGAWRHEYMTKGRPLSTSDTIIAATAHIKDYCLVTNNVKDYPMPELQLYRGLLTHDQ